MLRSREGRGSRVSSKALLCAVSIRSAIGKGEFSAAPDSPGPEVAKLTQAAKGNRYGHRDAP